MEKCFHYSLCLCESGRLVFETFFNTHIMLADMSVCLPKQQGEILVSLWTEKKQIGHLLKHIVCCSDIWSLPPTFSSLHFYLVFFWGNRIPNKIRVTEPCGSAYFILWRYDYTTQFYTSLVKSCIIDFRKNVC